MGSSSLAWHPYIYASQLLMIPGMAALSSVILYGRRRWKRRVLTILLVGTLGPPVALFLVVLPIGLLSWAADISVWLFRFLLLVVLGPMFCGFFLAIRKTSQRSVPLEVSQWLADRNADSSTRQRWRDRTVSRLLWIPLLLVLITFLFMPEIWGLLTHLQNFQTDRTPGYEIRVPATWAVLYSETDSRTGWFNLGGIAGRGIGFNLGRYRRQWDIPLSDWSVGSEGTGFGWGVTRSVVPDERTYLKSNPGATRHAFQIGKATLVCFESHPSVWRTVKESLVLIECEGSDRLRASFTGEEMHVKAFYEMLSSITPALPKSVK